VLILRGPARRTIRATPRDLVKLDAKLWDLAIMK
jgi:hypothetical protein